MLYMFLVEAMKVIYIADLKLEVSLHSPVWITEQDYKGSLCLKTLESQGLVRVSRKQQSRVEKAPHTPSKRKRLPETRKEAPLRKKETPEPITKRKETHETYNKKEIPEDLIPLIQRTIAEAISQGLQNIQTVTPTMQPTQKKETVKEDIPLFIPSGLVPEGFSTITVEAKASETDGLDEATAALKRLRRKNE